jgi:ribulose 1,5-bisphosphate synthetase/thiazole synthase
LVWAERTKEGNAIILFVKINLPALVQEVVYSERGIGRGVLGGGVHVLLHQQTSRLPGNAILSDLHLMYLEDQSYLASIEGLQTVTLVHCSAAIEYPVVAIDQCDVLL